MTPLNVPIIREWIAELRAGTYPREVGLLTVVRDGVKHCCGLGVLCELAVKHGVLEASEPHSLIGDNAMMHIYAGGAVSTEPLAVCRWAGLRMSLIKAVMLANDRMGGSHNEVADLLEWRLAEYEAEHSSKEADNDGTC